MITASDVNRVQALISTDRRSSYLLGNLIDVVTELQRLIAEQTAPDQTRLRLYRNLFAIASDIWNIGILIQRIEWTRQYATQHSDFSHTWRDFASLDILQFHVEFRSIFDYVAKIFRLTARTPKSLPPDNYRKLYSWLVDSKDLDKTKRVNQLGQRASDLVSATSCFLEFGDIRDSIIHTGSFTLVAGEPTDGIIFQIYNPSKTTGTIQNQVFLFNQNVADFSLYGAFWLTHLFLFLEDFAAILAECLALTLSHNSRLYSPGLDPAHLWMDKLANRLPSQ